MQVFVSLSVFAHNEKFGSWCLVEKDQSGKQNLPKLELTKFHSKTIVNKIINDILGIDWSIPIRQDGFYEKDNDTVYVLYSTYLENKVGLKDNKYSWIKLNELNELDDFDKKMIRTASIKRF
jgi:hypothetical protein